MDTLSTFCRICLLLHPACHGFHLSLTLYLYCSQRGCQWVSQGLLSLPLKGASCCPLAQGDIPLNHTALAQLPEDGDCSGISAVTLEAQEGEEDVREASDDPYNTFLLGNIVPVTHRKETEQQIVQQAVSPAGSAAQPLAWPLVGGAPISEFQTESYMTLAFPSLFPTGAADFSAPRLHPVTIRYYFKHLMMYI